MRVRDEAADDLKWAAIMVLTGCVFITQLGQEAPEYHEIGELDASHVTMTWFLDAWDPCHVCNGHTRGGSRLDANKQPLLA